MGNEKKRNEIEETASALIENVEDTVFEQPTDDLKQDRTVQADGENSADGIGIFQKYRIKDVVFLAVITACTLATGAVMPLLVNIPLFGIVQLGLGLQFSIFPVIGMMKVRKPGALLLQSVFISVFLIFMSPPMALIVVCALVAEGIALLFFHGYQSDWACVVAGTVYMPLTLPLMYVYYHLFYAVTGSEKASTSMFLGAAGSGMVIGMSVAVIALCFVGSVIGMLVSKELRKAGVLKK